MRHIFTRGPAFAALLGVLACDQLRALLERPAPPQKPSVPGVDSGPWLLDPQTGRITVAWLTQTPSIGRVWYGTTATDRLATEEGHPVTEHRVTITALQPQTQYRYRVEGSDDSFVFTSAPEAGAEGPIDVLVYGDNRTNSGDHALVARAAASEHAQLALHTGDMVVNAGEPDRWRIWFHEEHDLLAATPIVPTVGNHEITDNGVAYSKYFQHRDRPAYWSFDYGPIHLAVLDSFETSAGATPHAAGVSEAQKAWFEEDLKNVPKDRHVWVLVHQGPYAHPAHLRPAHGGSEAVRATLAVGRLVHPVEVVFAGHEHFYERGEIDGLQYFVVGGGGAPLEDPDKSYPGVQTVQKALSYVMVRVCGCHVSGVTRDIAGKVIDRFRLAGCPKPCGNQQGLTALAAVEDLDGGAPDAGVKRRSRRARSDEAADAGVPDAAAAGSPSQ